MRPTRWKSVPALCVVLTMSLTACGFDGFDGADVSASKEAAPRPSSASSSGPVANVDHWHAAYATFVCDTFLEPPYDEGPDIEGIHTHGDGLIHIHPFVNAASGENAVFERFTDMIGVEVTDGRLSLPDGTDLVDGDECDDGPGRVALFVWEPDASADAEPEIVTKDVGDVPFLADGQQFVLAFVPEGVVPPQPYSTPDLEYPEDLPPKDDFGITTTVPPERS